MNGVVFSWLAVGVLAASPREVGFAQTSTMLPALALLLVGGHVADRVDPRRVVIGLHLIGALPMLALATLVSAGGLSLAWLITYGLALGSVSAFVMPARDTLLSRVAGTDMMRTVTGMTAIQFGAQAFGGLLAGSADKIGIAAVLIAQALIVVLGALGVARLPDAAAGEQAPSESSALTAIREGLGEVWRNPTLRICVLLVSSVGVFFIGQFVVTFPIIVREVYGGGPFEMALVLMQFPLGAILGSLAIRARGGIRRKGPALLLALLAGASVMGILSLDLPYPLFVIGTLLWGVGGAVFINTSRTLVQETAPPALRGRVLSAYQLGFLGSGPVGALLAGFVIAATGPLEALFLFACAMMLFLLAVTLTTKARHLR